MSVRPISAVPRAGKRISDRLAIAGGRRFVGRSAELELFKTALAAAEPAFVVLHVHGPGGIGKTTLLQQFSRLAQDASRAVVRLDLRDTEPTAEIFRTMLGQAMQVDHVSGQELAAHWPRDGLLFLDSYEPGSALDVWLRESFLPCLPAQSLVVTAGRKPPAMVWSTDVAWGSLSRIIALRNLEPEESRIYLDQRGVSAPLQHEILGCTYGHPLALSLAADAATRNADTKSFDLSHEADLVRTLLQHLVDEPPSARHRLALHACAAVLVLTEPLLAAVLEADPREMFEWLGSLSFIEASAQGLRPHDLAREVLYADARLRGYEQRLALNGRLIGHLYERFQRAHGIEKQRLWFELIYLQRSHEAMRPYFAWNAFATQYAEPARTADAEPIIAMTRRREGDESAAIARYWLEKQPEAFLAFRDLAGQLQGYMAMLRLEAVTAEDRRVDPAADQICTYVEKHGALREGEVISVTRFCMAIDGSQTDPVLLNLLGANCCTCWTSLPRMAWSFCTLDDANYWKPLFASLHIWYADEMDFEVGGQRYGVFQHDWRVETVMQWMMLKVERASQDEAQPIAREPAQPLLVLASADFAAAVEQALRSHARDDELAKNPLLRTRLTFERTGTEGLKALVLEAVNSLSTNPKDRKAHQCVWHTFVEPAKTQEQAAEKIGLPFNTYRYQLTRGMNAVTQWLWQREIGPA